MIKKLFVFIFSFVLILCFSISSFAMSIPGNAENIIDNVSNDKQLLTPDRLVYLRTDESGKYSSVNAGVVFEVSPRYAIDPSYLPQTTYVNTRGVNIDDSVPLSMRYLYHSLSYDGSFGLYRQSIYLSKASQGTQLDRFYFQVDFRDFSIPLENSSGRKSFINFTGIPTDKTYPFSYSVNYAVKEGYNVTFKNLLVQLESNNSGTFAIGFGDICDTIKQDAEQKGYTLYLVNDDLYIRTLSFSGYSREGYIILAQSLEDGIDVHPSNLFPYIEEVPDFLSSLIANISNFFSTTLFQIGGVNISFGLVFAMPFVISILFIFLRKFAGG